MSLNWRLESARVFHQRTAHSPRSVRADRHGLDWDNEPAPFKIYTDLAPLALPRDVLTVEMDTLEALSGAAAGEARVDLERLAALFFYSAGVTRRRAHPGGRTFYFRAAPSTGALYQTEAYVVTGDVGGLAAGVYHFCPGDFALRALRQGDFRAALAEAAADEGMARQPATIVLSAIYWRNTWKYRARGYRHLFWDSGTILAHALAVAHGLGLPARLVAGFVEADVHHLLGLDPAREGALALVPVGVAAASAPPPPPMPPLDLRVIPLSAREVDYPLLRDAYDWSSLSSAAEVVEWRGRASGPASPPASGPPPVALSAPRRSAGRSLGETVLARGSTREFSGAAIDVEALSSALHHATHPFPADVSGGLVDLYLTVHAVNGLAPGAYAYDRGAHALRRLKDGDFRRQSAFLCLDQALGGAGSATVFFLADLERLLARLGNRGYRLANLEAGLIGGRLYLSAYAQRFGATGLTFYDDEVVDFFSPAAAGQAAIFVTALGRSAAGPRQPVAAPLSSPRAD